MPNLTTRILTAMLLLCFSTILFSSECYVLDINQGVLVLEDQYQGSDPLEHKENSPADNHIIIAHLNASGKPDVNSLDFTLHDTVKYQPHFEYTFPISNSLSDQLVFPDKFLTETISVLHSTVIIV